MILLEILVSGAAWLLLLPTLVVFIEVVLAVTHRSKPTDLEGERPRLAIVMPAHDEELGIEATLRLILPQMERFDRLLVVADNCSDNTAAIAAAAGAEVIVRTDAAQRGKGYALDFGVRHLKANAPDIVMIIDADCQVTPGAIDRLARLCARTSRPVQALYLMHAPCDAGTQLRIAELAWVIKNQVRPEGLRTLGLPCQLMGTGMAFPWAWISTARLATGHIVEDLILGLDLARAGAPPLFCPEALVTSNFPSSSLGVQGQRTRWEHGHMSVILREAPRLFFESLKNRNAGLMALAADLCVPPLALLGLQVGLLWSTSLIFYVVTKTMYPLWITSLTAALLALSIYLSWLRFGRHIISLGNLAIAAVYPLAKIPLYLRFLVARQLDWVRSKRDD